MARRGGNDILRQAAKVTASNEAGGSNRRRNRANGASAASVEASKAASRYA